MTIDKTPKRIDDTRVLSSEETATLPDGRVIILNEAELEVRRIWRLFESVLNEWLREIWITNEVKHIVVSDNTTKH